MSLEQSKLSKTEWIGIEKPLTENEQKILEFVQLGFENVNIRKSKTVTLLSHLKIEFTPAIEEYIFVTYFKSDIDDLKLQYKLTCELKTQKIPKITKADQIRLQKCKPNDIKTSNHGIIEYIILKLLAELIQLHKKHSDNWVVNFFTVSKLIATESAKHMNKFVITFTKSCLSTMSRLINYVDVINLAPKCIEQNELLTSISDMTLFTYQKELFTTLANNRETPKLILLSAPTSSGKTLSVSIVAKHYRVIFVCAARHVGLAQARASISLGRKVAIAFGCDTASDIRLHYSAIQVGGYDRDYRSGNIRRVDNTMGKNVEIIICDIKSYLVSMYYLMSFNPDSSSIVTFWDEPTISLDYATHELHPIISENWKENLIPNMVLMSATLPTIDDIPEIRTSFCEKFGQNAECKNIISHECRKSISMIDNNGFVIMPHFYASTFAKLKEIREHLAEYLTVLRYLDLTEVVKFLMFAEKSDWVPARQKISHRFTQISDITMETIKQYYLDVLCLIDEQSWGLVHTWAHLPSIRIQRIAPNIPAEELQQMRQIRKINSQTSMPPTTPMHIGSNLQGQPLERIVSLPVPSPSPPVDLLRPFVTDKCALYMTTYDAYTITDGPAAFLTEDVNKILSFCIHEAKIPAMIMGEIKTRISENDNINAQILAIEKEIDDLDTQADANVMHNDTKYAAKCAGSKIPEKSKDSKKIKQDDDDAADGSRTNKNNSNGQIRMKLAELERLRNMVKSISLSDIYVPNKSAHINKWASNAAFNIGTPFTCNLSDEYITRIMRLTGIDEKWKIGMLMGIGIVAKSNDIVSAEERRAVDKGQTAYQEILKELTDQQMLYMIIVSSDFIFGYNSMLSHGYISRDLILTQEKFIQSLGRFGRGDQKCPTIRLRDNSTIELLYFTQDIDNKPEIVNMRRMFC